MQSVSLKLSTLIVAAAPLLAIPACNQSQDCTLVGCGEGLGIRVQGPSWDLPPAVYDIEVVIDGETYDGSCERVDGLYACSRFQGTSPTTSWRMWGSGTSGINDSQFFGLEIRGRDDSQEQRPTEIRVSVWRDGELAIEQLFEPVYRTTYPNGEDCGPGCVGTEEALKVIVP